MSYNRDMNIHLYMPSTNAAFRVKTSNNAGVKSTTGTSLPKENKVNPTFSCNPKKGRKENINIAGPMAASTPKKLKRSPKHYRAPLPPPLRLQQHSEQQQQQPQQLQQEQSSLPIVSITEPLELFYSPSSNVEVIELETLSKPKRSSVSDSFSSTNSNSSSLTSLAKIENVNGVNGLLRSGEDEGAESDVEPSSGSLSHADEDGANILKRATTKKKRKFRNLTLGKKKKFEKSKDSTKANGDIVKGDKLKKNSKENNDKMEVTTASFSSFSGSTSSSHDSPPLTKHSMCKTKTIINGLIPDVGFDQPAEVKETMLVSQSSLASKRNLSFIQPSYRGHLQYFRKLFAPDLGSCIINEMLVDEFHCAYLNKILLQGKLYLTKNFVCFYANLLIHETRIVIPYIDIKLVEKATTLKLIPNAIEIETHGGQKYFFGSFLNRDQAFDYVMILWRSAIGNEKITWEEVCKLIKNSYTTDSMYYDLEQGEKVDLTVKKSKGLKRLSSQGSQTCLEEEEAEDVSDGSSLAISGNGSLGKTDHIFSCSNSNLNFETSNGQNFSHLHKSVGTSVSTLETSICDKESFLKTAWKDIINKMNDQRFKLSLLIIFILILIGEWMLILWLNHFSDGLKLMRDENVYLRSLLYLMNNTSPHPRTSSVESSSASIIEQCHSDQSCNLVQSLVRPFTG